MSLENAVPLTVCIVVNINTSAQTTYGCGLGIRSPGEAWLIILRDTQSKISMSVMKGSGEWQLKRQCV